VGKNYKNWNNQLGLPLSILNFDGQEDYWVLELGISKPQDMDELGSILRPDIVIITNIGPCHLEGLGSVSNVARYKAKILDYMKNESWAILNSDYPVLLEEAGLRQQIKQYLFSCADKKQSFWGEYLGYEEGKGRYEIGINEERYCFTLPWIGAHLTENITAVAVLAHLLGYSGSEVEQGLCQASLPEQRFSLSQKGKWTIIDDTYNANPFSMRAAIRTAMELAKDRELVLVLGDMAELGELSEEEHRKLGEFIQKINCNYVFFHGQHADDVKAGLSASEEWPGEFFICNTSEDFFSFFKSMKLKNAVVLFKGSRSSKMEEYVRILVSEKG
jgi:UDP-N-acetylmuramoyl-tripeptide--D-alanyl-D-alanine ligase